jgi:hypothetical protein
MRNPSASWSVWSSRAKVGRSRSSTMARTLSSARALDQSPSHPWRPCALLRRCPARLRWARSSWVCSSLVPFPWIPSSSVRALAEPTPGISGFRALATARNQWRPEEVQWGMRRQPVCSVSCPPRARLRGCCASTARGSGCRRTRAAARQGYRLRCRRRGGPARRRWHRPSTPQAPGGLPHTPCAPASRPRMRTHASGPGCRATPALKGSHCASRDGGLDHTHRAEAREREAVLTLRSGQRRRCDHASLNRTARQISARDSQV